VYCETLKNCAGPAIQNKEWNADIQCNAPPWQCVSAYRCSHSSTAGAFQLGVTLSNYHLFAYQKNWLRSQCFNDNDELMDVVRMWLSSQAADFFDKHTKIYFPIQVPHFQWQLLRSSLSMYIFFSHYLLTAHWRLLSE
jgi:hypothetical protein